MANLPAPMAPSLRSRRPATQTEVGPSPGIAKVKVAAAATAVTALDSAEDFDSPRGLEFMSLPTEIHIMISKLLIYPDALSLKHTNAYFYSLVNTGIKLKVEWLVERRSLHLECPNDRRCDLGSDLRFCRGSVPLLMQRRREHIDCESRPGLGCLVFGTSTCSHRRKRNNRWMPWRWLKMRFTFELWWLILAMVPLFCCWLWVAELFA